MFTYIVGVKLCIIMRDGGGNSNDGVGDNVCVCVCAWVCVHVCECVCMFDYVCMRVYVYACVITCMCVYVCVSMCVWVCMCIHVWLHDWCMCVCGGRGEQLALCTGLIKFKVLGLQSKVVNSIPTRALLYGNFEQVTLSVLLQCI